MKRFLKLTEVKTVRNDSICTTFREARVPILVNADCIVKIEDGFIHLGDFKIKVAESLEEVTTLLSNQSTD